MQWPLFAEAVSLNILDYLYTRLTFNNVRSSPFEILVNTGKYVIKQDEVFICKLKCALHREFEGEWDSQ